MHEESATGIEAAGGLVIDDQSQVGTGAARTSMPYPPIETDRDNDAKFKQLLTETTPTAVPSVQVLGGAVDVDAVVDFEVPGAA